METLDYILASASLPLRLDTQPFAPRFAPSAATRAGRAAAVISLDPVGRQRTVLIVDDEPSVLLTYTMILRQNGYEVEGVPTGQEAQALLAQRRFDLLVCDLALEKRRGGFEVLDFARQRYPDLPAILLTGYVSREAADEAQAQSVVVLFKPIDVETLLRTIAQLSGRDEHLAS